VQRRVYQQFELDWLFDRQDSRLDGPFYRREEETYCRKNEAPVRNLVNRVNGTAQPIGRTGRERAALFNHLNLVKSKRAMKLPAKEYVAGFYPAAHVFPRGMKCL
jgi:hypothetical protein